MRIDAAAGGTPPSSRWFIWGVIASGVAGAVASVPLFHVASPVGYAAASALTLLTAAFKVKLASGRAGSSVSAATAGVVFILVRFGAPAALPVAMASVWVQERTRATRPNPLLRTAFSMSSIALSVLAAGWVDDRLVASLPALPALGAIAATVSTYFIVNSLVVAGAVGPARGEAPLRYWRDTCLLAAPYYLLCAGAGGSAALAADHPTEAFLVVLLGVPAYLAYRGFAAYLGQLHERQQETEQALAQGLRITEALSLAITAQHGAPYEDLEQLQAYAMQLARLAGLDERRQRAVAMAVLLRDIGLVAAPRDLLLKTGPLTPAEKAELRAHPQASVAILAPARLPRETLDAIGSHHERWDGTGYPSGLSGRDIPMAGRIVALLDTYNALAQRHAPPGAGRLEPAAVTAALRLDAGRALDPVLTAWLLELLNGEAAASLPSPVDDLSADIDAPLRDRDAVLERIARGRRERECLYDIAEILGSSLPVADALSPVESRLRTIIAFSACELQLSPPPCDVSGEATGNPSGAVTVGSAAGDGHTPRADAGGARIAVGLDDGDEAVGILALWRDRDEPFDAADRSLLGKVADMLARKVGDARRLEAAGTVLVDPLTGLANRRSLELSVKRELERSRRESVHLSLVLIDVDGFSGINAAHGYATGDRLLRLIGETLKESVRPYDACARLGADRFAAMLPRCPADGAITRAQHFAAKVSALQIQTVKGPVRANVSTATATYPAEGLTFQALLDLVSLRLRPDAEAEAESSPEEAA
jgi:diguanylate cyclase (GGDEF)-like protein